MLWTAWVTLAALALYIWFGMNVSRARGRHKVMAPSVDGPVEFLNVLRVQINTTEQMVLLLPAMWMCALFFSDRWAAAGGVVWIIGRIIYARDYTQNAGKRTLGFVVGMVACVALMGATVAGLLTF